MKWADSYIGLPGLSMSQIPPGPVCRSRCVYGSFRSASALATASPAGPAPITQVSNGLSFTGLPPRSSRCTGFQGNVCIRRSAGTDPRGQGPDLSGRATPSGCAQTATEPPVLHQRVALPDDLHRRARRRSEACTGGAGGTRTHGRRIMSPLSILATLVDQRWFWPFSQVRRGLVTQPFSALVSLFRSLCPTCVQNASWKDKPNQLPRRSPQLGSRPHSWARP